MTISVPLACIPIGFVLVYAPKIAVSIAMGKQTEGYDNKHPRDQQAKLIGWGKRSVAAHANGFESFPAFAVGALVAHTSSGNTRMAAILAISYVVARTLYPLLYLANIDKLRSLTWFAGFCATVGLMALPFFG